MVSVPTSSRMGRCSLRRKVFFHGLLKDLVPEVIEVEADTVAEAIKRVTMQLPALRPTARTGRHRVQVVGYDSLTELFTEGTEEIHIVPQLAGAKNGGLMEVLIGAVLVTASFFMPAALSLLGPLMAQAGLMLILGGVLQLLQTPPQAKRSHYLGSPQNTVAIGTPIPILYGRRKVGGQLLSVNIEAINV
jgi:predicted phage tail protein